ncbi:hypothetical protein AB832_06770 [Flavobacteriaceae bacterium (ex Bugula neritina AB1)]|nr:hypothetical protein AB832_06770 [Flavobacteriaceae bacterium (ex Bugula neritina AB1)]
MISVILVDDECLARTGVSTWLKKSDYINVIGIAENGIEALEKIRKSTPDVVLLDITMPVMSGLEAIPLIKQGFPETKILILSQYDEDSFILNSMRKGAHGYLLKSTITPEILIEAIEVVKKQGFYFTDHVSRTLLEEIISVGAVTPKFDLSIELSKIEEDTLRLICEEKTSKEIADILFKSHKTIDKYRQGLMKKIGAKSVVGLVVFALSKGICT